MLEGSYLTSMLNLGTCLTVRVCTYFGLQLLLLLLLLSLASQAKSEMDEDGFFEGDICGQVGFVPGNMVEEITSPEELAQLPELLAAQAERRKEQSEWREGKRKWGRERRRGAMGGGERGGGERGEEGREERKKQRRQGWEGGKRGEEETRDSEGGRGGGNREGMAGGNKREGKEVTRKEVCVCEIYNYSAFYLQLFSIQCKPIFQFNPYAQQQGIIFFHHTYDCANLFLMKITKYGFFQ